jgi:two-component system, response regulator
MACPKWVLVVEDNSGDELIARRAFTSTKRTEDLVVAHHGEEAIELLNYKCSPVLVILDVKLPRVSGIEVLVAMKEDPRLRTVPVVIMTSSTEISDLGACYDLGCNAFVRKPIDFAEYMAAYEATLNFWLGKNLTLELVVER